MTRQGTESDERKDAVQIYVPVVSAHRYLPDGWEIVCSEGGIATLRKSLRPQ